MAVLRRILLLALWAAWSAPGYAQFADDPDEAPPAQPPPAARSPAKAKTPPAAKSKTAFPRGQRSNAGAAKEKAANEAAAEDAAAEDDPSTPVVTLRWRIGMVFEAQGSGFRQIRATVTVPMDWPEQRVRVVKEDLSPGVTISYTNVEGAARQMVVKIPAVDADREARAIVTFEVKRRMFEPPADTSGYVLADAKKLDRRLAMCLAPSPYIASNDAEIKKAAAELAAASKDSSAWKRVEAIYDWTRSKIQYEERPLDTPLKGMLNALHEGRGNCNELTSLFVAVCRASGIPARTVCVPQHCYPEFYLLDAQGQGHWFACQASGTPAFGAVPEKRPIMQRGDNVTAVDPKTNRRVRYRILPQTITGMPTTKGGQPVVRYICELEGEGEAAGKEATSGPSSAPAPSSGEDEPGT